MISRTEDSNSAVRVGESAPDFRLPATGEREIALADFRGRQPVVLAFYPFDWSPG